MWTQDGEQVGARLSFNDSRRSVDLSIDDIKQNYADKLMNASITPEGFVGKFDNELAYKPLVRQTGEHVATYTLMHANEVVCRIYPLQNRVEVITDRYIPFALTGSINYRCCI